MTRRLQLQPDGPSTMSPSAIPVVAQHDEIRFPIRLADVDGTRRLLQLRDVSFDFSAGGARYRTRGRAHDARLDLDITAELGCLPFSIQSRAARDEAMALLATPPAGANLRITRSSTIALDGQMTLHADVTPVTLVTALTEWVINVQPWISAISAPLAAARLPGRG